MRDAVRHTRAWLLTAYCVAGLALTAGCGHASGSPPGTPSSAAEMSNMQFSGPAEHVSGYGDELATNIDSHQDVTVIILDSSRVLTVEMNSTSRPAPSAAKRMTTSREVARLIIAKL